ncbi:MAG: polysaccharide export protein [bacterium]|nr:polysaccharide export protein [bacterium]
MLLLSTCLAEADGEPTLTDRPVEVVEVEYPTSEFIAETTYRVGADDFLKITILGYPDLSGSYHVDPEGYLNLPYLEDFVAVGYTPHELRKKLIEAWTPYLGHPQIGLEVLEYSSCRVYVLGEVKDPGLYTYRVRMSLIEALAAASGFSGNPVKSEVAIIRVLPDVTRLYLVDVRGILEEGLANLDVPLAAGDIVYVPRTFIGDWNEFLNNIAPTLRAVFDANRLYNLGW